KLLSEFRLPGEAQKIDRVVNTFAARYCENNPTVFESPGTQSQEITLDTAYVLAFSLIMLNTDAHNPNVKHKMTLREFIRNNRGINHQKDLPEEFLKKMFCNITENEIKMDSIDDEQQKMESLMATLVAKPDDLSSPDRCLIQQFNVGMLTEVDTEPVEHSRVLYLFNDLILITKAIKNGRKFQVKSKYCIGNDTCVENISLNGNPISMFFVDHPYSVRLFSNTSDKANSFIFDFKIQNNRKLFFDSIKEILAEMKGEIYEASDDDFNDHTLTKAAAAKAILEQTYAADDGNRYKKFGSLREARTKLHARFIPVKDP
ncbi:SEC7-like protein, partial [Rozella allomycis CSF55]